jgi:hypothetical protein
MGGTAAAGGFAYQHAQAVILALKLAVDPALRSVRVEAENDVIDAEVWSETGELVAGRQFKRRRSDDTWAQQDLIKELLRWSALATDHPTAEYEFVAEGRLGPTGRLVRDALTQAGRGDFGAIETLIGGQATDDFDLATMARARITVEEASYLSLIEDAEKAARSLLDNVSGEAEASERGRWVVLELLNLVTYRSGLGDPADRLITRDEVLALLATPRDRIPTAAWNDDMKGAFLGSILANSEEMPVQLNCKLDPAFITTVESGDTSLDSRLLEDWIDNQSVCLLGGPSGAGKSTAIVAMQRRAAQVGKIIILADAEEYVPGRLAALVSNSLNAYSVIGAYPAVGNTALTDPDLVLAIDGVSEIDAETRQELEAEIKQLLSAGTHSALLLSGRDTTAMRKILLRHSAATALVVESPELAQREELVATTFSVDEDFARFLVRRTQRILADLAENPLMLLLGARAIATGSDPNNAADIFHSVIRSVGIGNNYSESSVYEVGLGVAFTRLLSQGRRYCDSFAWLDLLKSVCQELSESGIEISVAELREFGSETGLIRRTPRDIVRAMHDSFADYLSALAIARKAAQMPGQLSAQDEARVRYLAGIAGVDGPTANLVARDLPFTAVAIAPMESRVPEEGWFAETKALVAELFPPAETPPRIAFWEDSAGRTVVTVDGPDEGWLQDSVPDDVAAGSGWTFVLEEPTGPLQVAVKIWKRFIDEVLAAPRLTENPVPKNLDESVQLLRSYSAQLVNYVGDLIRKLDVSGGESETLRERTTAQIQFWLSYTDAIGEERNRGVCFREAVDLEDGSEVVVGEGPPGLIWTGRGSVDSFVTQDPRQEAVKRVRKAINELVGRTWL